MEYIRERVEELKRENEALEKEKEQYRYLYNEQKEIIDALEQKINELEEYGRKMYRRYKELSGQEGNKREKRDKEAQEAIIRRDEEVWEK